MTCLEKQNRIIRNIEICLYGKTDSMPLKDIPLDNYKIIGINPGRELIRKNITERLHSRLEQGMVLEVENLLTNPNDIIGKFSNNYLMIISISN